MCSNMFVTAVLRVAEKFFLADAVNMDNMVQHQRKKSSIREEEHPTHTQSRQAGGRRTTTNRSRRGRCRCCGASCTLTMWACIETIRSAEENYEGDRHCVLGALD